MDGALDANVSTMAIPLNLRWKGAKEGQGMRDPLIALVTVHAVKLVTYALVALACVFDEKGGSELQG